MVRIRLYSLFVSIPMLLMIAGGVATFVEGFGTSFWNTGTILLTFGIVLHVIFVTNIECPKCGKSPWTFKDSPVHGTPWAAAECRRCGFDLRNGGTDATSKS